MLEFAWDQTRNSSLHFNGITRRSLPAADAKSFLGVSALAAARFVAIITEQLKWISDETNTRSCRYCFIKSCISEDVPCGVSSVLQESSVRSA